MPRPKKMRPRGAVRLLILEALKKLGSASASMIAEYAKLSTTHAYQQIKELLKAGEIEVEAGSSSPKWFHLANDIDNVSPAAPAGIEQAIADHESAIERRRAAEIELRAANKAVIATTERRLSFGWEDWSESCN